MERVATKTESFTKFKQQPGFARQYTNVYFDRLQVLKEVVQPPKSWSQSGTRRNRILDLNTGELSWVVGSIVRELANKPNIFQDLKQINHGRQPKHGFKYCSPNDKYFLEDEHGRVLIIGDLPSRELLVTGTVVALLGAQNHLGEFEAVDVCYPELCAQAPRSVPENESGKIALISGLGINEEDKSSEHKLSLLTEFLSEHNEISRLIVCGNSLKAPDEKLVGSRIMRPTTNGKALSDLDELLAVLATVLPVHLMPGESDPTTVAFPQMPMHPALLRRSKPLIESLALILETNPQKLTFDSVEMLGTSGQPVKDLMRYTEQTAESTPNLELDLLHKTLRWRHLAPTAPDTLWSYPYSDEDPMILDQRPHVYFTGNATHFATAVRDDVRLICVPVFHETGEVVLLDLKTLDVETVEF